MCRFQRNHTQDYQIRPNLVNTVSTNLYTSSSVKVGMFKCLPTQIVPTWPARFGFLVLPLAHLHWGLNTMAHSTITLEKHVGLFSSVVNALETLHITTIGNWARSMSEDLFCFVLLTFKIKSVFIIIWTKVLFNYKRKPLQIYMAADKDTNQNFQNFIEYRSWTNGFSQLKPLSAKVDCWEQSCSCLLDSQSRSELTPETLSF